MDTFRRALVIFLFLSAASCALSGGQAKLCETSRSLPSMGTFIQVKVLHNCSKSVSDDVFVKIQNRLDDLEDIFSLYINHSDLSRWNRGERSFPTRPDFDFLFSMSRKMHVDTNGYFDMKATGKVSFDGIAKGYAIEEVAKLIPTEYYQINFSGNAKWKTPKFEGASASSGNTHRPGHIVNPKTGKPVMIEGEFRVQGPNAMICDALSTAYFAAPAAERAAITKKFADYSLTVGD